MLEQARAGANVAVLVDGGRLAPFVKEFGIMGAPYLVDNYGQVLRLTHSPLFAGWSEKLRNAANLQVLSFDWFQGHRHVLTNVPVKVPADLKGVRMRTPGAPVWLETVRAMGATPTGMPWSEVYSALQTKVIDGAEAQHPAVYGARLYEVVKVITKTEHIYLITGIVTSRTWFDKLPAPTGGRSSRRRPTPQASGRPRRRSSRWPTTRRSCAKRASLSSRSTRRRSAPRRRASTRHSATRTCASR